MAAMVTTIEKSLNGSTGSILDIGMSAYGEQFVAR
jgi:hypothetical protein